MEMGRNEMVVWYQSPYPEEYTTLPKIYICEFCLKYMKFSSVMKRHASKCVWKHPPGITTISFIINVHVLTLCFLQGTRFIARTSCLCLKFAGRSINSIVRISA